MIEELLKSKWFAIGVTLTVGLLIGYFVIRPILRRIGKNIADKNLPTSSRLLRTIDRLSPIIGAVLLLNFLNYFPFDVTLKGSFHLILKVLDILVLGFIFSEILIFVYNKYSYRNDANSKVSSLFHIMIRIAVFFVVVLAISGVLNYDIKAMLTALGVGGLAVALALQDTLSNLFAGMQILASKQLKPGDYIKVDDAVDGYVLDINWRNTSVRTLSENVIIVPNSKISSSITTNYFTLQKNLYFQVGLGVHYDSDLEMVERVTLEVVNEVLKQFPKTSKKFKPRVRFYEFADSSINFNVWLTADTYENQFLVKHEFIKALQKRFAKEGINIPFPIRTIHMEK